MYKRFLFTSFCIIFSAAVFASARIDSTGVENNNGKQIIIHRVEAKETYYSIGRRYQVPPGEIISYNNNVNLHPGTLLKIPTDRPYQVSVSVRNSPAANSKLVDYKVGPKETLYSIARRFNTSVEAIKQLNNLTGNTLREGQILKVEPSGTTAPTVPVIIPAETNSADSGTSAEIDIRPNRYGLREMRERGAAVWITDENLDGTKMLALHRTAPVGTVVKITNPMTEKSTFAKVVGKFTENETTKDVIIVVTKAAADLLGALDKRFLVNIVYGVPFDE